MTNHDYTQNNPKKTSQTRESGTSFTPVRKKFATQMDEQLLERLRAYAKSEGRQLQAVLEDAVSEHLKAKQGYVMDPRVQAAHDHVLNKYDALFKRLAQ